MKAEEFMTRRAVACRVDQDLNQVAALMWDNDCGSIPVVDAHDRLVGMLTDRDVCMGAFTQGRPLRELRASGCMAREVVSCRASDSFDEVMRLMSAHRIRRVPVTDDDGHLVGIISVGDVVRAADGAGAKERKTLSTAVLATLAAISEPRLPAEPALPSPGKNARSRSRK